MIISTYSVTTGKPVGFTTFKREGNTVYGWNADVSYYEVIQKCESEEEAKDVLDTLTGKKPAILQEEPKTTKRRSSRKKSANVNLVDHEDER